MEWKFIKKLKDDRNIEEFENVIGKKLPLDYKEFIKNFNGGRPSKKLFRTVEGYEHVMKKFLSYNHEDLENIFLVNEWLIKEFENKYFAIASDPAGNYIVYNEEFKLDFWNHEVGKIELIGKDFQEFINSLYEE